MKKIIYTLIFSFFVFINNINAQEDKTTINKEDAFSYKKINVIDREEGSFLISENNIPKNNSNEKSIEIENRNSGVGETPANLSVSLTGGANYQIPIAVPTGIDGIIPEISLSYNSQGGNGLGGYGWNINGVSVISRIPASKFHDDQIDGVDFNNMDRFSLDGERLILKSGTYGADGAEYETEKYSNLKITSTGVSTYGGPMSFRVDYPDGSKALYGFNSNSRSHTNYTISYWENPQGVRIIYEYVKNHNSLSISKIKYGSKYPNNQINELRFNYGIRKRWDQSYINNVSIIRKDLLKSIESFSNGTRYRKYNLNHSSETNLKYDRLSSIREYSGDLSESHSLISFSYSTSDSSIDYNGMTTDLGLTNIEQRNSQVVSLDMTGNGKMDFIVYPNSKNKFWMFYDIQSGNNNHPYEVNTGGFESVFPSTLPHHQNQITSGQGLTIIQKGIDNEVKFKVYSKASATTSLPIAYDYTKIWNSPTYNYQNTSTYSTQKTIPKDYISGDFNGDGLTDVLAIGKPYTNRYCNDYDCREENNKRTITTPVLQQQNDEDDRAFQVRKKEYITNFNNRIPDSELPDDNGCFSCNTYTVHYKSTHFINLRRDISSGFVNSAGTLNQHIDDNDKLLTGDFNGDGKTDLYHIANGKIFIYSLDENNHLTLLWSLIDTGIKLTEPLLLGDYNGDGKTDFLDPVANNSHSFRVFISTGNDYDYETRTMPFKYVKTNWNGNNGVLTGYNLVPLDINGDGKTDIVDYKTITYNESSHPLSPSPPDGKQIIEIYNNHGLYNTITPTKIKFSIGGTKTKIGNLKHFPIPVFLTSNQPNKNLDFASISNKWVTNFSFTQDHREDVLVKSIVNNGVKYNIDYNCLDPDIYHNDYHTPIYEVEYGQVYPNVDLKLAPSTKVVTTINQVGVNSSVNIIPTKKIFVYKGAVYNAEGLGFLGFQAIARSNWHTGNSDRVFSVSKYDPSLRGATIEEYSMVSHFSFISPASNYISKTDYQYSSSLSNSKVFKLLLNSSLNQNNIEGTFTNTTYQYDTYNNPEIISTSFMGGSRTQNITYSNSTGTNYYIGRPINTTTNATIGSETFNTEQQFAYSGYLLSQRKIKGDGTPFNIETYNYDTFGNIIKKTITPNGESSREIEFEYDQSGRFIIKTIDVEDLETTYEYNTTFGNLIKEINPFGQETNFEYDSWDRQIKVIDYLGKENITDFTESDYAYTVTDTADDGSGMIVEYDALQRVSVIKEKNVFGEWISKKFEYDALGRLLKESEPYTGDNPSQWNEIIYDLYSRPTSKTLYTGRIINISYNNLSTTVDDGVKTVTSTRNQTGNIASVTDPGGTINYTYYGNGNLKTANYNGVVVSTEQDGWGRKTKLTDPSAGIFEYDYNGFGELINETTPKGTTDYVYSPLGKMLEKNISGDNTDMSILYSYNPTHKLISAITVTNSDGNNSNYNYGYDSNIRLDYISETNPFAEFSKRYTYDDFGRIETEKYHSKLLSNNKTSTKRIKNEYQNGVLKTIKDFNTNNNIWNTTSVNARGQLTSATVGSNIIKNNSYDAYGYLTNNNIEKNTGSISEVLMQLTTDFNVQKGTLNSRTNSMFSWSETFEYDNLDRLINFNDNNGDNNLTYDDFGRITFNNTIGNYNYTGTSYQVDNIDLNNQGDLYYQQNRLEQIKYNAFKKPFEINETGKEKIGFQYNAFMGRSHMFYGDTEDDILDRNNRKHYSYDGSMEISYDEDADETLFVTYIGGDAYSASAIWRSKSTASEDIADYYYLHRDYLGSILLITDGDGSPQEKRHFDAWGKIVKLTDGNDNPLGKLTFLDRGYTGHEHLQGVNLIHMNGRLYDPNLKRFLSPDNYIQDITNTQNFNRYGYVLNNPLRYVDPSGETSEDPGLSGTEQSFLGSLFGSAVLFVENNWDGIDKWTTKNIFRPLQKLVDNIGKLQPGRWIKGWFKKKDQPPVEYQNYENLSSDPLAGSSAITQNSSFSAGGTENGGLGIVKDYYSGLGRGYVNKMSAVGDSISGFFSDPIGTIGDSLQNTLNSYTTKEGLALRLRNATSNNNEFSPISMIIQDTLAAAKSENFASSIGETFGGKLANKTIEGASYAAGGIGGRFMNSMASKLGAPYFKPMKLNGSRSGWSFGKNYGAVTRFDFHKLSNKHNSRATSRMTIPKWLDGKKLPHYHRGKGNNLRYHRPWEIGPDGKRRY